MWGSVLCVADGLLPFVGMSCSLAVGGDASHRLGMGNGSTASPKRGWAMAPLLPQGSGSADAHRFG